MDSFFEKALFFCDKMQFQIHFLRFIVQLQTLRLMNFIDTFYAYCIISIL